MEGRGRGSLSSPISLSDHFGSSSYPLNTSVLPWSCWVPWGAPEPPPPASGRKTLLQWLLCSLPGTPRHTLAAHRALCCVLRSAEHIFCRKKGKYTALFQLCMSQKLWKVCMRQDRINRHQHDSSDIQHMLKINVQHLSSLQSMVQWKGGPKMACFEVKNSCLHSWRGQNSLKY